MLLDLPRPARYFPLEKGVYEVAPNLRTFGSDFGNGALEHKIFQFDRAFRLFRQSKLECRAERLSKYYREVEHSPAVAKSIARLIIDRLLTESPELFEYKRASSGSFYLRCKLTRETLYFDTDLRLMRVETESGRVHPPYLNAFDALAMQVQEDLNVLTLDPASGRDWLSAVHVCSPSTWRPEEKVGQSFIGVHSPVPQAEAMLRASRGIVNAMVHKGPYVRFVWGLTTNPQPNHHPDPPVGVSYEQWRGKPLTSVSEGTKPYMWVERQVVWGCPEANASLFTIRFSCIDLAEIKANPEEKALFKATLLSMSPEVREYKGLAESFDKILTWIEL